MSDTTKRIRKPEETTSDRTKRLMAAGIMVDELAAERLDIQVDQTGKVWVHLDGVTVLRIGYAEVIHATVDQRGFDRKHFRLRGTTVES